MSLRRALMFVVLSLLASQAALAQPATERPAVNGGAVGPRTPDGRPDLQGIWHYGTATPLQRFEEFADRPFISDEEAAAWVAKQLSERSADIRNKNPAADLARENNDFWFERPVAMAKINGQVMTSLVVDPPNGRVPILPVVPNGPPPDPNRADNPEDRNPGGRCLVHPAGPPMVGGSPVPAYLQIVQTPDYVMLYAEVANTARIIPTPKREHLPGDMRQWRGDSVGWWEGDTFVVESTNFKSGTNLRGFGVGPGMGVFTRPNFHLIERFSLAAPDMLLYEFTVTNPKVLLTALDCPCANGEDRGEDVRDCLPRRELRAGVHPPGSTGGGEGTATAGVSLTRSVTRAIPSRTHRIIPLAVHQIHTKRIRCLTDPVRIVRQSVVLAVLAVLPGSAQDHPDFSGAWVRIEPSPETEPTLVVRQGSTSINIEQKSFPGPRSGTYGVGTFGGVVGGAIDSCGGGSLQWMWKGATLTVTRQQTVCSDREILQSKHEEVWSLDTDSRLVVLITDEETGAAATTTRFAYRRSP